MLEEIKEIITNCLQVDGISDFTADTPLLGNIAEFDSMAVVTVITALEENYGFEIDDDEIDAEVFETLGSLVSFVELKQNSL